MTGTVCWKGTITTLQRCRTPRIWMTRSYMGELVEPLGFDSIWATEHYGSAYSMQPNPLQYLAYWAGRTSRVDVGTAVIVAPWWNPVRLASEISMLDILLKGQASSIWESAVASPRTNTLR